MENNKKKIKLHIGCAHNYREGWINIDDNKNNSIKKLDLDIKTNSPLPFDKNSVDIIFDRKFYEKVIGDKNLFTSTIINYKYILKENGQIQIIVPDDNIKDQLNTLLKGLGFSDVKFIELGEEKKHSKNKIPCLVLIFFDYNTTKKSLDFITKFNDRLDIHIVENYSEYTNEYIKPYVLELLKKNKIKSYYLFEENIGFNAIEKVVETKAQYINDFDYFIITDGDLISENDDWINEQINILEKNPEVILSGLKLDLINLPSEELYPDSKNWVPPAKEIEGKNYLDGQTGWVFTFIKTEFFFFILNLIKKEGSHISDYKVYQVIQMFGKKWVRTKNSKAYHLTWDIYSDLNHPYTKWKNSHTYQQIWCHNKDCNYTLYNNSDL